MRLFSDSIGRKAVMAVSGLLMVLFLVGHLAGNSSIWGGSNALNSYAFHLHELPALVWGTRIVMGLALVFHVVLAIAVTLRNRESHPERYAVSRSLRATFAGKTMIYSGLIILAFIGYHLLQFTFQATPGLVISRDALQRFDVYAMVSAAFHTGPIVLVYVVGMVALFLHLAHGIQSVFQTLGLNNAKLLPGFFAGSRVAAVIFLAGFAAIPVLIFAGIFAK